MQTWTTIILSYLCPPQLSALECGVSLAATNFYEEGQTQKQRNSAGGTYGGMRNGPNQFLRDNLPIQGMFLEWWNTTKSLSNIWQYFSCLLDEGIPKIWKKLTSHGAFLKADQGRAKMCCQMGWIGCAILQVAQKAIVRIQFLAYFWNPLIK